METIKKLQFFARFLRKQGGYVRNKKSGYASRFDFRVSKAPYSGIEIYNAKKGESLFLWSKELVDLASGLNLSYYFQTGEIGGTHKVVLRIY